MVECPVGFRCTTCVDRPNTKPAGTKHADSDWKIAAKAFGASAIVGVAAAWVMALVNIPFIDCLISFFLGIYGGRWLKQFLDHRLGAKTASTVVFGALFGMCFSPLIFTPLVIFHMLSAAITGNAPVMECLLGVVSFLFTPACFFAGILRPTVWGDF